MMTKSLAFRIRWSWGGSLGAVNDTTWVAFVRLGFADRKIKSTELTDLRVLSQNDNTFKHFQSV